MLISKRCAVSFQNREKPMYFIPMEGGVPRGIEYVSSPLGKVEFHDDHLTIGAIKELKIDYSRIKCIQLSRHWFFNYIEIIHNDPELPKIIWFKTIVGTKSFFKRLSKELGGKIKFQ